MIALISLSQQFALYCQPAESLCRKDFQHLFLSQKRRGLNRGEWGRSRLHEARLARLKYEQQVGTLVNRDEIQVSAFNKFRTFRDLLLSVPDRLSAQLAAETDPTASVGTSSLARFDVARDLEYRIMRIVIDLNSTTNYSRERAHPTFTTRSSKPFSASNI